MALRKTYFKTLFCLLICFCCIAISVLAQEADSLYHALEKYKMEDTSKVKLYAITAEAYRYTSPDSMLIIVNKGIALAEKIGFERGKAQCLITKTLACLIIGKNEEGLRLCREAIDICIRTHDFLKLGSAYYYMAALNYNLSRYDEAIKYYQKTADAYQGSTYYDRIGDALDNIGICYSTTGNYTESLKYYLEGLKIREKSGDKYGVATSMGNIGRVYASLGNHKKALEYINKSLASLKGGSLEMLMMNYENAGNVYLTTQDTLKALSAFNTAAQMADSARQPSEKNRILVNTAEVLLTMKKYNEAYSVYQRCIANNAIPNTPAVEAMIHRGLGLVYSNTGKATEGARELEKAIAMFRENDMRDHLNETQKGLAEAYGRAHQYDKAFQAIMLFSAGRDSILDEETGKKTQQLQYEYDLQKKQTEIELLAKDKAIAQSRAEKQNAVTIGLASAMALLFIVIVVMYRGRQKEKAAKEVIIQQAASLSELNNYKDKIFSVLSHDMRGPIGALDTSITMLDQQIISPEEFEELKGMIHKQLTSVTLLMDNLLKWSMAHLTGGKAIKKEKLDISELITQNISLFQNAADEKQIKIQNNTPPGISATCDPGNIDIIIRNLISNAVKFTKPGGTISISATNNPGNIALSFTDDGVGMSADQLRKLFVIAPENSTSGTMGEQGIGLGLLMSYEFARANGGDITVQSEVGRGSTFTLTLP